MVIKATDIMVCILIEELLWSLCSLRCRCCDDAEKIEQRRTKYIISLGICYIIAGVSDN